MYIVALKVLALMEQSMASGNNNESGFTFIGLLILISIMGIAMAATGVVWRHDLQRDKERELLFIGGEFRKAIALYYEKSPGVIKTYPKNLNELLQDKRYPTIQRHLRQIYRDPMTNNGEWGVVRRPDGTITGVFSLAQQMPIKKAGFSVEESMFEQAKQYSDWKFVYQQTAAAITKK